MPVELLTCWPESIRLAAFASNSNVCCVNLMSRPSATSTQRGVDAMALSPGALQAQLPLNIDHRLDGDDLNISTSIVPLAAQCSKDGVSLNPSTCLVLSTEFNHMVPPSKIRYGVSLILQFVDEKFGPTGWSPAISHWTAYSRSLRGALRQAASAVASGLESLARNRPLMAIDAGAVAKALKEAPLLCDIASCFVEIATAIWQTVGCGCALTYAFPMLSSVNTATTAAALSAYNSRRGAGIHRSSCSNSSVNSFTAQFASATESLGSPAKGAEQEAPPQVKRRLLCHKPCSAETAAHDTCDEVTRIRALANLYFKSPEMLAQLMTACIGFSHPDSLVSPFAFGVADKVAALHVDDVPPTVLHVDDMSASNASPALGASPQWRTDFVKRVSPMHSPISQESHTSDTDSLQLPVADVGGATRFVICSPDGDTGRDALTICAMYFRPDPISSNLHRLLWNPGSVGRDDAFDGDDASSDDENGGEFDVKGESSPRWFRYSATTATYASFAVGVDTWDGGFNPVVWIKQSQLSEPDIARLFNAGSYTRLVVINAIDLIKEPTKSYCTVIFGKPRPRREDVAVGMVPKAVREMGSAPVLRCPLVSSVSIRHRLDLLFKLTDPSKGRQVAPEAAMTSSSANFQDVLGSLDVVRFLVQKRSRALRETLIAFSRGVPSHQLCGTDSGASASHPAKAATATAAPWGSRDSSFVSGSAPLSNDLVRAANLMGDDTLLMQHPPQRPAGATPAKSSHPGGASKSVNADALLASASSSAAQRIVDAYSCGDALLAAAILGDPMVYGAYKVVEEVSQRRPVSQ